MQRSTAIPWLLKPDRAIWCKCGWTSVDGGETPCYLFEELICLAHSMVQHPIVFNLPAQPIERGRGCYEFGNSFSKFTISIAAIAASKPLLPALPPARSIACS